jgi:hypothetical protein
MDEKNDIGPFFKHVKRDFPFTVPEGYFEQFHVRLDKVVQQTQHSQRKLYVRHYLAAASVVAAMLLVSTLVFRHQYRQRLEDRFHAEISRTVDMELYSISEETILESMYPGPLEDGQSASGNEGEMIDYLLNEDLNEEDLVNSL